MEHLDEISVEELQDALDNVGRKKPIQRPLVAIAYKSGVTQTKLAEGYNVQRRTIYRLLKHSKKRTASSIHPSCRRLLKEAGFRYQKPRRSADEDEHEAFYDEPTKSGGKWTPP